MIKFNICSESINILHPIYDSLICFNSVKVSRLNINQNSISGKDKIHKIRICSIKSGGYLWFFDGYEWFAT